MFSVLKSRIIQGCRTGKFPSAPPTLPPGFQGRPRIGADAAANGFEAASALCPAKAAIWRDGKPAIDLGRCIFCGKCAEACPSIEFTNEYRLGAFSRDELIITAGAETAPSPTLPPAAAPEVSDAVKAFRSLCSRSLKIRQVSAGGCGACELDFNVLNTPVWDISRFGIQVVASPRHADAVLLTGPVTKNMLLALEKTFNAMSEPRFLIAAGACAISGGLYAESPETLSGALGASLPAPILHIPGCPPHPATTLEALLRLMGRMPKHAAQ